MKLRHALSGFLAVLIVASHVPVLAGARDAQWKEVEKAASKGLPKTGIEKLGPMIEAAIREKAWPEAIKAIALRISLEGEIEGRRPEEKITRMEAELARAPKEMAPMMEAILADWYWQYFRTYIEPRSYQAPETNQDVATSDRQRIFAEIDKHFSRALTAEAELRAVPIGEFDALLEKGTVPDSYRPTLYDFIAYEALQFYGSGEDANAKAEDAFDLAADGPIFGPVEEFMKWEPETTDTQSTTLHAVRLLQHQLRIHADDADKSAFLHADLQRIDFGLNVAFGESKYVRYREARKAFAERWADHELSALARHDWARELMEENPAEAHEIARQGAAAFPQSLGGKQCLELIRVIEKKELKIEAERVWSAPLPAIQVRYRNITELTFRLVRFDWLNELRRTPGDDEEKRLLGMKPEREWRVDLPPTLDFCERVEQLPTPKDLKPGYYLLIASPDRKFREKDNVVSYTDLWVSALALVMRSREGEPKLEGFVLDARSGEPIEGAQVQLWIEKDDKYTAGPSMKSNRDGLFSAQLPDKTNALALATFKDQRVATESSYSLVHYPARHEASIETFLFTDRSIYRPGQTIQYKGICTRADDDRNEYKAVAGRKQTVVFLDTNHTEIARQQHRTNDFGSFSGSFTAPRDRLPGNMTMHVEDLDRSEVSFNVEEYKRPKFQVVIDAPKAAAKLNEQVRLEGRATGYAGEAIGGAKMRYSVMRTVRFPDSWAVRFWWRTQRQGVEQAIAHGTGVTNADGSFALEFPARPDASISPKDEPVFDFEVHAEVTDTTGETRTMDRSVHVGYAALQASLQAAEWLIDGQPIELGIKTQTLDDEGQRAEGTVKVYHLKQPDQVARSPFPPNRSNDSDDRTFPPADTPEPPKPDPANPDSWELGELAAEHAFTTDGDGKAMLAFQLAAGPYRAVLETQDRFGTKVTAQVRLFVLQPDGPNLAVRIPNLVVAPKWTLEPGEEFTALWGTGYDQGRAYVEIEHRGKLLQHFWTAPGRGQQEIKQAVTEAMRGGFALRVTMVRENRIYTTDRTVEVPWSNKKLTLKWDHFVSKLEPGKKETWSIVVSGPDAQRAAVEMVATLYDQSLDAFREHSWHRWVQPLDVFRRDSSYRQIAFENGLKEFVNLQGSWAVDPAAVELTYRRFPDAIGAKVWDFSAPSPPGAELKEVIEPDTAQAAPKPGRNLVGGLATARSNSVNYDVGEEKAPPTVIDLSKVSARKNLNETAFFFPQLLAREDGSVSMEFTMPEALTTWRFMGFAHDRDLRSGYLEDKVVTAKDIMVQPNPPRFLREGDALEFTVKVSNQSPTRQAGKVRLTLAGARTGQSADAALGNTVPDLDFDLPASESRTFSWKLTVPDGAEPLSYKAVGSTDKLSDGEEGLLPVLSRRVLVTESLPLPIRGAQTKAFDFTRLLDSAKSDTLKSQSLTVQMVSNPSWYAVMALPYLMEFPHECTEQTFNRLYANALARHIAASDPKIRGVFDQWKATPALDSPLEKNQDLNSVLLDETPWVRQAQAGSAARKNVGLLFDENRLNDETARLLRKLAEQQREDGAWPWFPGGPANDYITLYITTGFGRLRHLGVKLDTSAAVKSLARLDGWIDRQYRDILKAGHKDDNHLSPTVALYLYGRSFFLGEQPVAPAHREAMDYFLGQARQHWLALGDRQPQAHLAIALKRFGDKPAAEGIMKSIREHAVSNEETGMSWRDTEPSWWWYRAPIETQALMIEAFDEVMNDAKAVEDCKVWLLKQKQTQDWKTTKATADAIYALLLRGENLLASDALVEVALGGAAIKPEKVEAGTGFYEQRYGRGEIKPEQGHITVKKTDPGVSWSSVHWQYLEDMAKITALDGTPLQITKTLYTKQLTKAGPKLEEVKGPVKVGDELVVRLTLHTDRDLEYVHLKDHRGSGTEPVNVLSHYKVQDGLGYYETTRDTASHFFIDYLPKGNYVFEYSTHVVHKGRYQTGFAAIECMYAPEFGSHSESLWIEAQ